MIGTIFLREFSHLLLKLASKGCAGASLEDLFGMVYTQEELDPLTGKYKKYFDLINLNVTLKDTRKALHIKSNINSSLPEIRYLRAKQHLPQKPLS